VDHVRLNVSLSAAAGRPSWSRLSVSVSPPSAARRLRSHPLADFAGSGVEVERQISSHLVPSPSGGGPSRSHALRFVASPDGQLSPASPSNKHHPCARPWAGLLDSPQAASLAARSRALLALTFSPSAGGSR
jgi:hypothetical protein